MNKNYRTFTKAQKAKWLKKAQAHQKADRFAQGEWLRTNGGKLHRGCFFGCMMQKSDDVLDTAVKEMNLPAWIVFVGEKIFEGLPEEEAVLFPVQLLEAIQTTQDTEPIWKKWHYTILMDKKHGQYKYCGEDKECKKAVKMCAELFLLDEIDEAAAYSAAYSAAISARSAISAACSVSSDYSARSAISAACSVSSTIFASSARSAHFSAIFADYSASSAYSAVKGNHYLWMRDTLLTLLSE